MSTTGSTPGSTTSTPPGEPPALPPAPLTVAAVARRLGVAPATLRTWDRRYGLGPTEHAAGAHRRYTARDVARLQTMRRLTLQGVPPAAAAAAALEVEPLVTTIERSVHVGGGRVLPLPGAEAAVRGLGRAAMALDGRAVTDAVRAELARRGVAATWDEVLRPVLVGVGARWAATGEGVEVEHLLSDCVTTALREVTAQQPTAAEGLRPVLLACAPDEQHTLPLHVLSAALAERAVVARTLGAALPADALAAAVRRTGPALLLLWSQRPATADPRVLAALPTTRPPTALVAGGPGWDEAALPARVTPATDLKSAVALVEQALGA